MPDYISTPPQNVLPVWDSFEAIFFAAAGVIVGIVFAYLFPSISRTLRRRFRSNRHSAVTDISQSFVLARDCVQRGEFRQAVKIYGEILTSDRVSSSGVHRALFELAQVYFSLGLYARAFDTAFELLKRKPRGEDILQFLLRVLSVYSDEEKLFKIFRVCKGISSEKLRKQMAHLACQYAEVKLKSRANHKKVIELIRLALRTDPHSTHAHFLLWQSSSQNVRNKTKLDVKAKWIALAADLDCWVHLCEEFNLSPHAGAKHILSLTLEMMQDDPHFESFQIVHNEFIDVVDLKKFSASKQKILLESILSSIFLLGNIQTQITENHLLHFFEKILESNQLLKVVFNVNNMINPEVLRLGALVHRCSKCQSFFARFDWSCSVCHTPEPLQACVSIFMECVFDVSQNWNSHQGHCH